MAFEEGPGYSIGWLGSIPCFRFRSVVRGFLLRDAWVPFCVRWVCRTEDFALQGRLVGWVGGLLAMFRSEAEEWGRGFDWMRCDAVRCDMIGMGSRNGDLLRGGLFR